MNSNPLVNWLNKELSSLLESDVGDEYAKNILNIETEPELKELVGSLLDLSIPKNKLFLDELLKRMKKPANHQNVTVYKKPDLEETGHKVNKSKATKTEPDSQLKQNKKAGFSLQSADNSKSPNRRVCNCQASKHGLIANCLKCGRIVCEQEGSGPCYFCGNLVCTREEMEKIKRGSNKGEQLKKELLSRGWKGTDSLGDSIASFENMKLYGETDDSEKLRKAIEHKNKLIEFDRTSAKRTQVIDDESDYFNTNSKWIGQKQKALLDAKQEELREKRFGSRVNKTFTFDFAGRSVKDEQQDLSFKKYAAEIENILNDKDNENYFSGTIAKVEENLFAPIYVEPEESETTKIRKLTQRDDKDKNKLNVFRLQDQQLQEMKDDGMCLSMHQPWASLLVHGIKVHEGRTWYTPYRGRLWIHAAAKQPYDYEIKEIEVFYKLFYNNQNINFPKSYPTSCLLGYVDLNDCLSSDTYRAKYPNGESQSEFVFICSNPRELVVKMPMPGQHKIFKLDKNVHAIAKKTTLIYHDSMDSEKNKQRDEDL